MYEAWNSVKRGIRGLRCQSLSPVLDLKDSKINISSHHRNNHRKCGGSRSVKYLKDGSKERVGKQTVGESHPSSALVGQVCHQGSGKLEAVGGRNVSKPAVTELVDGKESRKVVEIICGSSSKSQENFAGIGKVLKVHNRPKTLTEFEDYREIVKIGGSKLSEKNPRCLADGNELLRFYGTSVACSIGMNNSSSSLCKFYKCGVSQILRHGFSVRKETHNGEMGVFTTSTCEWAMESIELEEGRHQSIRKTLI